MVAPKSSPLPRFTIGQLVATPGALQALGQARQKPIEFIARHQTGDWGTVCEEDAEANEQSLIHGERLLSAYVLNTGVKIWLITEANREATTILLPEEY